MKSIRTFALPALLASTALPVAAQAQAAGVAPDLTSLTSAVDYSTIGPAILATGALGMTILLAWVAVKYLRRVARSA
jgi:hypothetical protein